MHQAGEAAVHDQMVISRASTTTSARIVVRNGPVYDPAAPGVEHHGDVHLALGRTVLGDADP